MGCDVRAHVQSARVILAPVDGIQYSVNIFIFRMAPFVFSTGMGRPLLLILFVGADGGENSRLADCEYKGEY